jgi:peptide/nickel transport system substrate-binding protein
LRAANFPVVTAASGGMYHIFTNNKRFPFDEKSVRQALGFAVDRKTLIERVLNGGEHARGVYPANLPFAGPTPLPFDLARARQILDGANWRAGSDGVRARDGKKLEFELLTYPQRPELGLMATAIQAMLKDAGVATTIRSVEDITKPVNAGDYTATMYSIQTAPTGDPSYILNLIYKSTAVQNVQLGYGSPALDAVIDRLIAETDPARRADLAREAQAILIEDAPATYLMQPLIHLAHTPKLTGVEAHPVEQYLLTHRWKLG